MKRVYQLSLIVLGIVVLEGCSTVQTTVLPQANDHYQVIATARNSAEAQQGAVAKAGKVCSDQQKKLVVISNHEKYQGSSKQLAVISDVADQAAMMAGVVGAPSTRTNTDYKVIVDFRCD